jgi:hypothetical protein
MKASRLMVGLMFAAALTAAAANAHGKTPNHTSPCPPAGQRAPAPQANGYAVDEDRLQITEVWASMWFVLTVIASFTIIKVADIQSKQR